ncbi:hypothetical protein DRN69_08200 [Candidatus Pacearchaeota archaeon]|nr:MAG: hypothetical protein DRN69_08200 [Candidatus Pacearchaeota archaeon]
MANPITSLKAGQLTLGDAVLIALSKNVTERVATPLIGNATLFSGAIKTGIAVLLNRMIGGKFGNIVSTGLMVDGTEDFVSAVLGGSLGELIPGQTSGNVNII